MKVAIDTSIVYAGMHAFGNVTGYLELVAPPHVGDVVSFLSPKADLHFPGYGFGGLLQVTARILTASALDGGISVALENIAVDSREGAVAVCKYLEDGFGLFVTVYEEIENRT